MRSIIIFIILMLAKVNGVMAIEKFPESPRISAAEAYRIFKTGEAVFIDANPPHAYNQKHILGSVNIPNDGPKDIEFLRSMDLRFPKDAKLITYCL